MEDMACGLHDFSHLVVDVGRIRVVFSYFAIKPEKADTLKLVMYVT
jgi:hypothetical protein